MKNVHAQSKSKTAFLSQRPPRTTWMTNCASLRSEIWWAWPTTVISQRRSVKLGALMCWAVTLTRIWTRTDCRKYQVPPRSLYSHNLIQPFFFPLVEEVEGNVFTLWCLCETASEVTCLLLALTKTLPSNTLIHLVFFLFFLISVYLFSSLNTGPTQLVILGENQMKIVYFF